MSNKNEQVIFEQMSIFQIMNLLEDKENTFSSEDVSKIIDKLSGVKRKIPKTDYYNTEKYP